MARSRNIKPSFFTSEQLSENCPLGRLLFIGLWTLADYKGDLEWKEKTIKVQILPWDDCSVKELAINLDNSGLIRFYSDGIKTFVNIPNFLKHQNPHKNEREKGTDIPSYTEDMRQAIDLKGLTINRDKSGLKRECSHSDRADSLFLIPSSCFPLKDSPLPAEVPQQADEQEKVITDKPAEKKSKATRLPNDWIPSQEYFDELANIDEKLKPKFNSIAATFKDYWVAKSGKDATKTDWLATWRNWVRREAEKNAKNNGGNKPSYHDRRADLTDAVTDYERATNF